MCGALRRCGRSLASHRGARIQTGSVNHKSSGRGVDRARPSRRPWFADHGISLRADPSFPELRVGHAPRVRRSDGGVRRRAHRLVAVRQGPARQGQLTGPDRATQRRPSHRAAQRGQGRALAAQTRPAGQGRRHGWTRSRSRRRWGGSRSSRPGTGSRWNARSWPSRARRARSRRWRSSSASTPRPRQQWPLLPEPFKISVPRYSPRVADSAGRRMMLESFQAGRFAHQCWRGTRRSRDKWRANLPDLRSWG